MPTKGHYTLFQVLDCLQRFIFIFAVASTDPVLLYTFGEIKPLTLKAQGFNCYCCGFLAGFKKNTRENPFEKLYKDTPSESPSRTREDDLRQILDEEVLPESGQLFPGARLLT